MELQATDIAWMAGLFDGEGCVDFRVTADGYLSTRLRIGMTSFDAICRFSDLCDQADVPNRWYEQVLPSGKIVFSCDVARRESVVALAELLMQYSITKRNDLEAAVSAIRMVSEIGNQRAYSFMREAIPPRYKQRSR